MTLYSLIASSLAGPGAPSNTIGVDGAIYLDLTTGLFYGPKTAGAWPPLPGSISAIQDEGSALSTRAALNFTGAGVTAADDAANNRTNLTIPGSPAPALVTSLPGSPTDGQEIYYQNAAMATDGVIWHLRYRSASSSAYKWEFVGGSPLTGLDPAVGSITSTTYVASGPGITAPLTGDYMISFGLNFYMTTAGPAGYASYTVGATPAADADSLSQASSTTGIYASRDKRKNAITAGSALTMAYKVTSGTMQAGDRWINATPVRIG